ncbi:MAG: hypothetical protein SGILL_008184 [Bacillariaceae sp.]
MQSPIHEPKSPTKEDKEGAIDFDNLMEKQRELLKHIRSSPDKKKDKLSLDAKPPTAPNGQEWGWSFERNPTSRNSTAAYDGAAAASLPQKKATSKKQKRQQAEEWISDWHYERVTSEAKQAPAPAFNGHDSEATNQWYFERIPSTKPAAATASDSNHHDDVMEMDDFAALEAAVVNVNPDDISLEDLVADVDEDDVIMSVEDDEGLLPLNDTGASHETPEYMQELKHRQYSAAYMDELKHRQVTVAKTVEATQDRMDQDGDAEMGGDDAMKTPDSSAHTPTSSHHSPRSLGKPTRSPSCVMESLDSSRSSKGFPRPQNLMHSKSESHKHSMQLPCAEGMDGLFQNTLDKLTRSMQRSAESRRSLKIKTEHTQEYERNLCVHQILQSVESSSRQVDNCLQWYRPSDEPAPAAVASSSKHAASS